MSTEQFPYPQVVADYARDIQEHMVTHFQISPEEAAGRIKRAFRLETFEKGEDDLIFHEEPEFWANTIYYKPGTKWWLHDEELTPQEYP